MKDADYDRLVQQEELILRVTELIAEAMERKNWSQADLAKELGVKPSEISQRLSGERNLTLRKVADLLQPLEMRLQPTLVDIGEEVAHRIGTRIIDDVNTASRYTETGIKLAASQ